MALVFNCTEDSHSAYGGDSIAPAKVVVNSIENTPKISNFFMKDEFIDQSDINDQYLQSGISPEIILKRVSKLLK